MQSTMHKQATLPASRQGVCRYAFKPVFVSRSGRLVAQSAAAIHDTRASISQLNFPFSRIAGQEEMKLALMLCVVDPNIGGVLIMGDRGTAKSVAVSDFHVTHPVSPSRPAWHMPPAC